MNERKPKTNPPPNGPLVPRPVITIIALAMTAGMLFNVWLDASSTDYDGGQATYLFAFLIAGVLGIPVGIEWARARKDDEPRS